MKKIITIYKYLFLIVALLFVVGCSEDPETQYNVNRGGNKTIHVKAESSERSIDVEANGAWEAKVDVASREWLAVEEASGVNSGAFSIKVNTNNYFARKGVVLVRVIDKMEPDTIFIKQYGVVPVLEYLDGEEKSYANRNGDYRSAINTNLSDRYSDDVEFVINYSEESKDWVDTMYFTPKYDSIVVKLAKNDVFTKRSATINIIYTDALGEQFATSQFITQDPKGGSVNTKVLSFGEVRELISEAEGELVIEADIAVGGVVISDCGNKNVAENPNISYTALDYSVNDKTFYLQNSDATFGFMVTTATIEDNMFYRYDKLSISLKGLKLIKRSNPVRYSIEGMTKTMIYSQDVAVPGNNVKKIRRISELTDDDIYTFVTIKDCELPIRKGALTPFNEGYAKRMSTYPLLVRDIKGDHMFLMTNTVCTYRRDGKALPMGSGRISGIIVYEKSTRFENDGVIGRYQIRHLLKEDIDIDASASNSFSTLIAEWNKMVVDGKNLRATSGEGIIYHTSTTAIGGITDYGGLDFAGNGIISGSKKLSFGNKTWWNSSNDSPYAWMVRFSTKGLRSTNISLQLSSFNNSVGAPRYWNVEWSESESGPWSKVGEYTVPDVAQWEKTLYTQLAAPKNVNINLPLDLLNKVNVYLRLIPSSKKAGTTTTYDGGTVAANKDNAIFYLSVRYNK